MNIIQMYHVWFEYIQKLFKLFFHFNRTKWTCKCHQLIHILWKIHLPRCLYILRIIHYEHCNIMTMFLEQLFKI